MSSSGPSFQARSPSAPAAPPIVWAAPGGAPRPFDDVPLPADGGRPEDLVQGSAAWFAARCGRVTASRIADVVARTKTGWGASRANYLAELVAERLTGRVTDGYRSAAMQWGQDCEAEALRLRVPPRSGCRAGRVRAASADPDERRQPGRPDRRRRPARDQGAQHRHPSRHPRRRTIPARYVAQMLWQMACTERLWCEFVSYDPRLPEVMRLFVSRLPRDAAVIAGLEQAVGAFLDELDAKVSGLELLYGPAN